ncbi:hypothetical protein [Romboutsia weinsteinii]|nr:hypothetical protein [Romboutsia weinsteinii]
MITLALAIIILFPFILTFTAYALTDGLAFQGDNIDKNINDLELVHI